ncbi:transposase family protein [Streptomyces xanthochromogenes]|uniref:transposase family protein n=1 Tax=Streptomyces xanthochromogenes TaxID=67384 RepID=UPI00341BFC19
MVRVDAHCTTAGAVCPGCGAWSTRVNSSYLRFPTDVASAGRSVGIQLRVRRFRCRNTLCSRRAFLEQIPGLTRRHGQRTERLRSTLASIDLDPAGCGPRRVREPEYRPTPVLAAAVAPALRWSQGRWALDRRPGRGILGRTAGRGRASTAAMTRWKGALPGAAVPRRVVRPWAQRSRIPC